MVNYIKNSVIPQPTFGIKERNYFILSIDKTKTPGMVYSEKYLNNLDDVFWVSENLKNFKNLVVATKLPPIDQRRL